MRRLKILFNLIVQYRKDTLFVSTLSSKGLVLISDNNYIERYNPLKFCNEL